MLPRHARCVLSRFRCNGHSLLLGSYLSRIGRIENPSCSACEHPSQDISFCTVQLRTLCAAHSLATLCLFTTSCPGPGELPGFWGSMVSRHAPIPRKGSGNQQQQQQQVFTVLKNKLGCRFNNVKVYLAIRSTLSLVFFLLPENYKKRLAS